MKHGLCFFLIFCLFPVYVFSQNKSEFIHGYVYDSNTESGLADVNIYVDGKTKAGTTNSEGFLELLKFQIIHSLTILLLIMILFIFCIIRKPLHIIWESTECNCELDIRMLL